MRHSQGVIHLLELLTTYGRDKYLHWDVNDREGEFGDKLVQLLQPPNVVSVS